MDVTPFLEVKPAPRVVFDRLPERQSRARYMVPTPEGDWTVVTWAAHAQKIEELSLFLLSQGQRSGERGVVFGPNSVDWIASALAIQAAGGVMVPVYPASTPAQAAYIVEHSDARFLFVSGESALERVLSSFESYAKVERIVVLEDALDPSQVVKKLHAAGQKVPSFAEVEKKIISFSRARALGRAKGEEDPKAFRRTLDAVSNDQVGIMLYTSGTTGHPKGVPLTHNNIGTNTRDWLKNNAALLDEGAIDLFWLPMSHIFGYGEANIGDILGFTSYLTTPSEVPQKIKEVRPAVFMSVPSYWEKLAQAALQATDPEEKKQKLMEATGGRLRFCLSGGAGLKREVKEVYHSSGILIIEGYGLTETSPTLTINRPDAFRFDSVGKPLPSVQLRLAEDGEILAKGPNVFGGYHKDPTATAQAFTEDGWFKTGDIGRFTDDGFLQIVDRKKDILVTAGGKNVPPANIELRFRDDPFINHLVVYGDGERYLVAGVWLNDAAVEAHLVRQGLPANKEAVERLVENRIERVNGELASYESIKRFVILDRPLTVEDGFLTATLKVRRKKIYESFGEQFRGLYR
ncbi:MAG: long-chain fatty acid--CoA ligase [Deltaproteobacteria bacterium]|nr:long-chain fatty acid--CoA ligase [Deltaproteobacteria bacterium]